MWALQVYACRVLQCVAVCSSVLQRVAVCCSLPFFLGYDCGIKGAVAVGAAGICMQYVAGCCSLLFFLGYDCSTKGEVDASSGLQYVAVSCSELQCKAVDWHDFSKVSLLPNCPYTMSVKLTFANIYRVFV